MTDRTEGWGWLGNARKAHYFRGGRSLCGKWMALRGLVWDDGDPNAGSSDDCAECRRRYDREKARAG